MLLWIHIFNAASLMMILRMVQKIIEINNDKGREITDNVVELKDCTVVMPGIPIDNYSQDTRVLKMKIWLQLQKFADELPGMEHCILDINMSPVKSHYLNFIYELHDIQKQIHKFETEKSKKKIKLHIKRKLESKLKLLYDHQLKHINEFHEVLHKDERNKHFYQKIDWKHKQTVLQHAYVTFSSK